MSFFKKQLKLLVIGLFGIFLSTAAFAVDEVFNVTMYVVKALTITETSALTFPNTVSPASATDVTVSTGTADAAAFTVDGEPGQSVNVSVNMAAPMDDGGGNTITVDTFSISPGATGTLDGVTGQLTVSVGATAHLSASQVAGSYSGTATLTVAYP